MEYILAFTLFILGALLASFINALMYRLDNDYKSPEIFTERSHCETCKHQLSWYELVPVIGYLFIKGRCPKCKEKVFWYYPLSEALLGIFFYALFLVGASVWIYIVVLIMFSLSYFDVTSKSIPSSITHFLIALGVLFAVYNSIVAQEVVVGGGVLISLVIAGFTSILNRYKKAFGLGDILVFIGLGFFLTTWEMIILYFLSAIVAVLFVLPLIIQDKRWLKRYLPYVPFIMTAFVITYYLSSVYSFSSIVIL